MSFALIAGLGLVAGMISANVHAGISKSSHVRSASGSATFELKTSRDFKSTKESFLSNHDKLVGLLPYVESAKSIQKSSRENPVAGASKTFTLRNLVYVHPAKQFNAKQLDAGPLIMQIDVIDTTCVKNEGCVESLSVKYSGPVIQYQTFQGADFQNTPRVPDSFEFNLTISPEDEGKSAKLLGSVTSKNRNYLDFIRKMGPQNTPVSEEAILGVIASWAQDAARRFVESQP